MIMQILKNKIKKLLMDKHFKYSQHKIIYCAICPPKNAWWNIGFLVLLISIFLIFITGPEASINVNRLAATLLVLAQLTHIGSYRPVGEALPDLLDIASAVHVGDYLPILRWMPKEPVYDAIQYCRGSIAKYGAVCRQLELGPSWLDFVLKYM